MKPTFLKLQARVGIPSKSNLHLYESILINLVQYCSLILIKHLSGKIGHPKVT